MTETTGNYVIRRCTDQRDASVLAAVGVNTFVEAFGHLYKIEDLEAFLEQSHSTGVYAASLKDKRCSLWLCENAAGEAVGYAQAGPACLPVDNKPDNAGELHRLYLRQQDQGGGLGGRLLETALDWLDTHFDHVYLSVYAKNLGAQRLYERYGFERVQDYFFMVGAHPDPEFIMKRNVLRSG